MKADEYAYGKAVQRMSAWTPLPKLRPRLTASKIRLPMYRDSKEILSILNNEKVKYLVVGGYTVSLHAQPRARKATMSAWRRFRGLQHDRQ